MMFAMEKLFRVSEHCEHLDPCQVLNRDVRKSAQLRKQLSFSQVRIVQAQRSIS